MKSMVIELRPGPQILKLMGPLFVNLESIDFLELLRVDFEHGMKLVLLDVTVKEGLSIDDVELPPSITIFNVLKQEGRRYTCLVKAQAPQDMLRYFQEYDMDLVWDTPSRFSEGSFVLGCTGELSDLRKFVNLMEGLGEVKVLKMQPAIFHNEDLLDTLTDKQREALKAAMRNGYYDYPRRISATELAERLGLSKTTLVEHLRKAEGRLMGEIVVDY